MANFFKEYKEKQKQNLKKYSVTQEEIETIMNNINRNKGEDHSDHPEWTKKDKSEDVSFVYDTEYGWVQNEQ